MSENPVTETRGGQRPDWARVKPGEPLPELPVNQGPAVDPETGEPDRSRGRIWEDYADEAGY